MLERILLIPVLASALGCGAALFGSAPTPELETRLPPTRDTGGENVLSVTRSPDGLFRVPVVIGTASASFVVDTGASRTVVGQSTLARLTSGQPQGRDFTSAPSGKLLTFSGTVPYRLVSVERMRIGTREFGPVSLAVIDHPHTPDVIGQDLIVRMGEVTIRGEELSFR